ncbi:MAG: hypothetical protein ABSB28_12010 [Candidatus Bathyarchaeia archaeon]
MQLTIIGREANALYSRLHGAGASKSRGGYNWKVKVCPAKIEEPKTKRKKKGKILRVCQMHTKGASVEEIAQKLDISPRLVRSYLWRGLNPEKYRALLQRYFTKKKETAKPNGI